MENRQTIYIAAYPKSGSTWLTRLLGDVLNSPTGGSMLEQDSKEVATEGQDRPGPYIVRKGHFVLVDNDTGQAVPAPHRLAWRQLTNEKIVFLVRDPRDICVSGAWHWNKSTDQKAIESFMGRMFMGDVAKCGRWDEYINNYNNHMVFAVRYEDLLHNPYDRIFQILSHLEFKSDKTSVYSSVRRQSFNNRQSQIGNNPQELRRNNMRKGIAGDWKNHFTPQMNDRMWSEFGWIMEKLGYKK